MSVKKKAIELLSDAAREKHGKMVSVTNIIEFLFENHIATYEGLRNYYIRKRFDEEKKIRPESPENNIYFDISMEVDMSKESIRYIVYPEKYYKSEVA